MPRSRSPRIASMLAAVVAVSVPGGHVVAAPCWSPPVSAAVSDPFREPACRWCPGNRGIEYATRPGQVVRAVDTGRVSWAGTAAGVVYVVVEHRDGLRVTYGSLAERRHATGDVVVRGQTIGTTGAVLHFGVRRGDRYLDPASFLGRWVGRPRLLPTDGRPGVRPPPPRLRCDR